MKLPPQVNTALPLLEAAGYESCLIGGAVDIKAGFVRCVGNPDARFCEDGLRILRAMSLASVLDMSIETNTAAAIHRNKELLSGIAPERIRIELTAILCGAAVKDILIDYADVLAVCLPEIVPMIGFEQHNPHHDKDVWLHTATVVASIAPEPLLRWAALLHDTGKPQCFSIGQDGVGHFYGHSERSTVLAEAILSRLRFDKASAERIVRLIRYHDLPLSADEKLVRRLLNKHGVEAVHQLVELHKADTMGLAAEHMDRIPEFEAVSTMVDKILSEEARFSLKDLAINGNDLLTLGLSGKNIGIALQSCLNAVLDERVPNERSALLEFILQQS